MKSYTIPWDGVLHYLKGKRLSTSICCLLLQAPASLTASPMTEGTRELLAKINFYPLNYFSWFILITPIRKDIPFLDVQRMRRLARKLELLWITNVRPISLVKPSDRLEMQERLSHEQEKRWIVDATFRESCPARPLKEAF